MKRTFPAVKYHPQTPPIDKREIGDAAIPGERRIHTSHWAPLPPTRAISQWARSLEWRHAVTLHTAVGKNCITFYPFSCEALLPLFSIMTLWLKLSMTRLVLTLDTIDILYALCIQISAQITQYLSSVSVRLRTFNIIFVAQKFEYNKHKISIVSKVKKNQRIRTKKKEHKPTICATMHLWKHFAVPVYPLPINSLEFVQEVILPHYYLIHRKGTIKHLKTRHPIEGNICPV